MNNVFADSTRLLRRSLMVDGITSGVSGLVLLALPGPTAGVLGIGPPRALLTVGALLLLFAAFVVRTARRPVVRRGDALVVVGVNVAWVAGSLVLVALGGLTTEGQWIVGLVADVVLAFAIFESMGVRKMKSAPMRTQEA